MNTPSKEYRRQWRNKNKAKANEQTRQWRLRNVGYARKKNAEWKAAHPEYFREHQRRKLPKPARPEPSLCEVCGAPPKPPRKALCLDHCHATERFRGWLCNRCNVVLGAVKDSTALLNALANYLQEYNHETLQVPLLHTKRDEPEEI